MYAVKNGKFFCLFLDECQSVHRVLTCFKINWNSFFFKQTMRLQPSGYIQKITMFLLSINQMHGLPDFGNLFQEKQQT